MDAQSELEDTYSVNAIKGTVRKIRGKILLMLYS